MTTATTLEEAQQRAIDLLGVESKDIELQVIEPGARGLFGRVKSEARVRARIKPNPPAVRPPQKPLDSARVPVADDAAMDDVDPPSAEEVVIQGVSWTEVTASTVEEATIYLLDQLGADGEDAEVRVIGRTRGASRVRGRLNSQPEPERKKKPKSRKGAGGGANSGGSSVVSLADLTLRRGHSRRSFHLSMEGVVAETQRLEELDSWERHSTEYAQVRRRKAYLLGYMRHPADGDVVEQSEADRIAFQLEIQNLKALTKHEPAAGELVDRTIDILQQITDVDGTSGDSRIASTVAAQTAALVEEPILEAAEKGVDPRLHEVVKAASKEGIPAFQASLGWRRRLGETTEEAANRVGPPIPVGVAIGSTIGGALGLIGLGAAPVVGSALGIAVGLVWGWLQGFEDRA